MVNFSENSYILAENSINHLQRKINDKKTYKYDWQNLNNDLKMSTTIKHQLLTKVKLDSTKNLVIYILKICKYVVVFMSQFNLIQIYMITKTHRLFNLLSGNLQEVVSSFLKALMLTKSFHVIHFSIHTLLDKIMRL